MRIKGVVSTTPVRHGIAVCAATLDAAWKARDALNALWDLRDRTGPK